MDRILKFFFFKTKTPNFVFFRAVVFYGLECLQIFFPTYLDATKKSYKNWLFTAVRDLLPDDNFIQYQRSTKKLFRIPQPQIPTIKWKKI